MIGACPPLELLGDYETGRLGPDDQARCAEHVEECPTCLGFVGLVEDWKAPVDAVPAPDPRLLLRIVKAQAPPAPGAAESDDGDPGLWDRIAGRAEEAWAPFARTMEELWDGPAFGMAGFAKLLLGGAAVAGAAYAGKRTVDAALDGELDAGSLAALVVAAPAGAMLLRSWLSLLTGDVDAAAELAQKLPDDDEDTWRVRAWVAHERDKPASLDRALRRLDRLSPGSAHEIRGHLSKGRRGLDAFAKGSARELVTRAAARDWARAARR